MSEDFLKKMARSSHERAAAISRTFSDDDLDRPAFPLRLNGFDLIAEIKNRSPAEGELATEGHSRTDRAQQYVYGGAAAISVLTEPTRFDGDLSHLEEVVGEVSAAEIPVMRKDFIVHTDQVLEAKAAGASGILLIAGMLDVEQTKSLLDCAFEHDLFVLLESFDELDLELTAHLLQRADYAAQTENDKFLVGVNTRDLRSLQVDPHRLKKFGPLLPRETVAVAESGLHTPDDAVRAVGWGYRMALVGTALMRAEDPATLIAGMLSAGRAV
jgi:indole-3-glycerol phosphate synthase